ncbi:hypothetical protein CSV80_03605 [Sporosarcina sp. P12(2017)]|uniref:hypothetical protein n=1 Tax=unclassified Sporosarcina TaxID=2647733 RepID=UPI000C165B2D|nr:MULTISPECIES: hypothetical protein [unclassified Sporosarcina]PIC58620.1 hypothetical protein CSV81_03600 [Sporosarcina sp. P10]PIC61939.1 hypothetical protein CSV80_03605 [Sporosarcina sp. P12(2017)]
MTDRELLELLVDKVSNMEQDISSLKTNISIIKEEQISMKQAISEQVVRSVANSQKIDTFSEQILFNKVKSDDMRKTQRLLNDHDTDIRIIKKLLTK